MLLQQTEDGLKLRSSFTLQVHPLICRCPSARKLLQVVSVCFHRSPAAARRSEVELVVPQSEKAVAWVEVASALSLSACKTYSHMHSQLLSMEISGSNCIEYISYLLSSKWGSAILDKLNIIQERVNDYSMTWNCSYILNQQLIVLQN